jgi:septal ring factor EnvC (AmiA/AmiB activator)
MSRIVLFLATALTLALTPSLGAQSQPKQKDAVLQRYLLEEFAQLNTKLGELSDKMAATASKLDQLEQKQNSLDAELRNAQTVSKAIDSSLGTLRLSSQQDLFSLRTDLSQARQELAALAELVRRSSPANAAPSAPATTAAKPADAPASPDSVVLEGYITAVSGDEVAINLGSSAGVKPGAQFNVFKAADPRTTVGVAEIIQVTDANNSRAKVIFVRPDTHLEFSDSVRLR